MTNKELLSNTISYLRFPLIVGVIFIHNKMGEIDVQGVKLSYNEYPWLTHIMDFFSSVLPTVCVPLFFFISGFLFFYNNDFDKNIYIKKIKSRCNTLLKPYLIWNFIGFLILLIQMHPRFSSLFPLLKDYRIDISEFLSYFWMRELPMDPPGGHAMPINYPLWFIRDLFILVIASPIIYWLIKKTKYSFIIILCVIWFYNLGLHVGLPGLCHQSLFFFPLGAYFSINNINFVAFANKLRWSPFLYTFLAVVDTMTKGEADNFLFHKLGILVGLIFFVYLASIIVLKKNIKTNNISRDACFFIFAMHGLFITKFMKAIVMTTHPNSPYFVLFIYFFVPIITIFICLFLYKIICFYSPVVAKTITGG